MKKTERKRKLLKRFLPAWTVIFSALLLAGCGEDPTAPIQREETTAATGRETGQENRQEETSESEETEGAVELLSGTHHIEIHIQDMGVIAVELDADSAPITVTNFVNLAQDGFYDGLTFHRVIEGFMMQGGDPLGTGFGGSEETITGEFSANNIENNLSHTRGAISMARSQAYNSASSQFFIVHQDSTFLDGQYAAFGYVTDGMDIVDEICGNTAVQGENGAVQMEDRAVIEKILVID
ncbi:MAG: peptidylprolyl isomerase [Lachnospiraceae bacterium]|nr:peptidylprolyl isomerase [Lachnospiraceae bacterium]